MSEKLLSRRSFLRLVTVTSGAIVVAACQQNVPPPPTTAAPQEVAETTEAPATSVSPQTAEEILTGTPGLMPGCPDRTKGWKTTLPDLPPAAPWTPPIVITMARRTQPAVKFAPGDDHDNNPWTRMMKELFGIEWKTAYVFTAGEQQAKISLAMAANDLPDVHNELDIVQSLDLIEADMVEDITDAYETYASDELKATLEWGGHIAWTYYEIDGRKWGIPSLSRAAQDEKVLWVREDWLDKVGMKPPETLDELHDVAVAFAEADVGQGAPGTTWGLLACQRLTGWMGSLDAIFGAHRVMPGQWSQDGQGGLKHDSIDPRSKEALALLSQWYQDGVFMPDYYTIHVKDIRDQIIGNRAGMQIGMPTSSFGRESMANDPEARWMWTDIPTGPDGQRGCRRSPAEGSVGVVFRKGFEHIDKVLQQANFDIRLIEDPWRRMHGWCDANIQWEGDAITGDNGWNGWASGAIFNVSGNTQNPETEMNQIRFRQEYAETVARDDWDAYMEYLLDDPTGIGALQDAARVFVVERTNTERTLKNEFFALPTPTMVERSADLKTMEEETYHGIITGNLALSAFDTFVDNWRKQGGDQITNEVNEWYAQRRKS